MYSKLTIVGLTLLMLAGSVLIPVVIYVVVGWYIVPCFVRGSADGTLWLAQIVMIACLMLMFILCCLSMYAAVKMNACASPQRPSTQSDSADAAHLERAPAVPPSDDPDTP